MLTREARKMEENVEFNSTLRRIVLLGTPLALTVLLLFHPSPYDDVAGQLVPIAGWWIALHYRASNGMTWTSKPGCSRSGAHAPSRRAATSSRLPRVARDAIYGSPRVLWRLSECTVGAS